MQEGISTATCYNRKKKYGGLWPLIIGALIGAALIQDFDSLADSFNEGYNKTRR